MVDGASELLAVRGVPEWERMEDMSLEDVVQALALRCRPEGPLEGSLCESTHGREDSAPGR